VRALVVDAFVRRTEIAIVTVTLMLAAIGIIDGRKDTADVGDALVNRAGIPVTATDCAFSAFVVR
jgi:hypothetical protein